MSLYKSRVNYFHLHNVRSSDGPRTKVPERQFPVFCHGIAWPCHQAAPKTEQGKDVASHTAFTSEHKMTPKCHGFGIKQKKQDAMDGCVLASYTIWNSEVEIQTGCPAVSADWWMDFYQLNNCEQLDLFCQLCFVSLRICHVLKTAFITTKDEIVWLLCVFSWRPGRGFGSRRSQSHLFHFRHRNWISSLHQYNLCCLIELSRLLYAWFCLVVGWGCKQLKQQLSCLSNSAEAATEAGGKAVVWFHIILGDSFEDCTNNCTRGNPGALFTSDMEWFFNQTSWKGLMRDESCFFHVTKAEWVKTFGDLYFMWTCSTELKCFAPVKNS